MNESLKSVKELQIGLHSFSLPERLKLLWQEKVKIVDRSRMSELLSAVEQNGSGFIRGQLPPKYRFLDPKSGKEYPDSRKVMLHVAQGTSGFSVSVVPGMHVVTGYEGNQGTYDPFAQFLHILRHQFHGGKLVNSYLLRPHYMEQLNKYGYEGNPTDGKTVKSSLDEVIGDGYKLLIWTGFTHNYLCSSETDIRTNEYGQGNIGHASLSQIEPFIFLDPMANTTDRLHFYESQLRGIALPNPVRVIDCSGHEITLT